MSTTYKVHNFTKINVDISTPDLLIFQIHLEIIKLLNHNSKMMSLKNEVMVLFLRNHLKIKEAEQ